MCIGKRGWGFLLNLVSFCALTPSAACISDSFCDARSALLCSVWWFPSVQVLPEATLSIRHKSICTQRTSLVLHSNGKVTSFPLVCGEQSYRTNTNDDAENYSYNEFHTRLSTPSYIRSAHTLYPASGQGRSRRVFFPTYEPIHKDSQLFGEVLVRGLRYGGKNNPLVPFP